MKTTDSDGKAWVRGFATALAETHRLLIADGRDPGLCRVARAAGVDLAECRKAGVCAFDYDRLVRAGLT
jgi:hypothetical protein